MAVNSNETLPKETSGLTPEQWTEAFALLMQSVKNLLNRIKKLESQMEELSNANI